MRSSSRLAGRAHQRSRSDELIPARALGLLPLLVVLAACASSPDPVPVAPERIAVTPIEEGRLFGGRAVYAAAAPLETARAVILDFPSQASYRPMILEATPVSIGKNAGTVLFRFRGPMGIDPNATCDYVVEEDDETVTVRYEMTDPSMALWALQGSFTLRSVDGGARTLIDQRLLLSALVVDREQLLEDLRTDAAAIRSRIESMAR